MTGWGGGLRWCLSARHPSQECALMSDATATKPAKPAKPGATVDLVVSLAKRRGFVYPCGEIYGGTRSARDYGPLGVELRENIKRQWWRTMVQQRDDMVGLDSSVILPRQVWEASGHVD